MSSWLSLSLPNPFKSSEGEQEEDHQQQNPTPHTAKEDLSVLGQTIGRQLRGVAAFLAPPPPSSATDDTASSSETFLGIKNDLVEIGGSFKTGLSLLSSNKAVTEISRFATNILQFRGEEEEEDEETVGITEEVVKFVREISKWPEFWTDFPVTLGNDFDMSDVQREHTATVEDLVPGLVLLRHEICKYLSEEQFWMIYFILLLPRLNEYDSKLLSTPEIVEVRGKLLQNLQNKNNASLEISEVSETVKTYQEGGKVNGTQANESSSHGNEVPAEVVNAAKGLKIDHHENTKWVEEEGIDKCMSVDAQKQSEDDFSFSDLEDDDNDLLGRIPGLKPAEINQVPSCSESNEWVRLNENPGTLGGEQKAVQSISREKDSEGEESNDWLTIDDTDLDSSTAA